MKIKVSELEKLVKDVLGTKYTKEQVDLISEIIMFGELSGRSSHGIMRLLPGSYGAMVDNIEGDPKIVNKTKVSSIIEGNKNPSMLIGALAVNEVIRLAKENGIGVVATKGTETSTGSLSYYVEKIAKNNLIGIVASQTGPMTSAFNTKSPIFGTNPLAFGFPKERMPLIFDMATSAITFGAIKNASLSGKLLPENVAIDSEGNMTTDPNKAMDGAILPFYNSYKGSGLALMVEILGGVLSGSGFTGLDEENGDGNFYLALSPDLLFDTKTFKRNLQRLVKNLEVQETIDGSKVRMPGENTLTTRDENLHKGELDINEDIFEKVRSLIA